MSESKAAVVRGAALLDSKAPDWFLWVDLTTLNMAMSSSCVLGQADLANDYDHMVEDISGLNFETDGEAIDQFTDEHGFTDPLGRWDELADLWAAEVTSRRLARSLQ